MRERENKGFLSGAEKIIGDGNDEDQFDDDDYYTEEGEHQTGKTKLNNAELMKMEINSSQNIDDKVIIPNHPSTSLECNKKRRVEGTKAKFKSPSATLMKYVLQRDQKAIRKSVHPVDAFLAGLAPTLKSLSPYHLNIAKSRIFNAVQEIEMDQIMNMQQTYAPLESTIETTSSIKTSPPPSRTQSPQ